MVKNKPKISPNGFNVLAILILFLLLPLATAYIQNPFSSTEYDDWENVLSEYSVSVGTPEFENYSSLSYSYWYNNGNINATDYYRSTNPTLNENEFRCKYIDEGKCSNFTTAPLNLMQGGTKSYQNSNNRVYQEFHQTHGYLTQTTTSQVSNYYGYSGDSNFEIRFWGESLRSLYDGEMIDAFKITYVDRNVLYNCNSATIDKLKIDYSIQFEKWDSSNLKWLKNQPIEYEATVDSMFKEVYLHQGGLGEHCFVGFSLEFRFNYIESVALLEFVENVWNESNFYVEIIDINPIDTNKSMTSIPLAFAGKDSFEIAIEKHSLDETKANLIVKSGTTILSIGIFVMSVASTSYWNPLKNWFKGGVGG